ncbi:hypothetical protein SAMN04488542_11219 [Fontibacillus panacisegetis]|uniref:Uncharacterized protein n=1 Tax=Fontibacillus panacisegetis TaxID=670482 RepID=A0A1G7LPH8_9BACL|nr:hypothetical protein [Fontibacillus panacisegetis]SDF51427.1 hypothetical protein SAMN04488542_11219 [Fontibacillus panacisegetis]
MKYIKVLESGDELKLTTGFGGKINVFWNGLKIQKSDGRYPVNMNNESKSLDISRHKFTGSPIVLLDGQEIEIAKKLKAYEWVISMLPLLLIFIGGALGGLLGALGFSVNVLLFRSKLPTAVKVILSILVLGVTVITHFVVAGLIYYYIAF